MELGDDATTGAGTCNTGSETAIRSNRARYFIGVPHSCKHESFIYYSLSNAVTQFVEDGPLAEQR